MSRARGVCGGIGGIVTVAAVGALVAAAPAVAQDPDPKPAQEKPDSVPPPADTAAVDSLAVDSLAVDSLAVDTAAAGTDPAPGDSAEAPAELPRDSLMRALAELEGFTVTEYAAEAARYDAEAARVELRGNASVQRGAEKMTADSLVTFSQRTEVVCGYGQPVLTGREGAPIESERVCYDTGRRQGVLAGARTTFQQNATWYLHGHEVVTSGTSRLYGRHTNFTSCDLDVPHYHFSAGSVKVVQDSVMVARNITLRFGDVPVFWLPFMMQSMKRGRRSGLLTPEFSLDDIARTKSDWDRHIRNIGYYWAINDYMGAEVALDWYSGHWMAMTGDLDYGWDRQFLRGNVAFTRYWRDDGSKEFTLRSYHNWQPTERTTLRISANYASATDFIQRNTFDPRELRRTIDSNAGLQHRFDWGALNLSAQRRQSLFDGKVTMTLPDARLSMQPITLLESSTGRDAWYGDVTWTGGSLSFTEDRVDVDEANPDVTQTDEVRRRASANTGFRVGAFTLSQQASLDQSVSSVTLADAVGGVSPLPSTAASPDFASTADPFGTTPDGTPLDSDPLRDARTALSWSSRLGYRQQLIGSTTLTPSVSLGGRFVRRDDTHGEFVPGPVRMDVGASLRTTIYGFWPGIGPFSRIRHKLSPSVNYSYSPRPAPLTLEQREVFGAVEGRVRNRVTLNLNQTFEAKYEADEADSTAVAGDTASADAAAGAAAAGEAGSPGEPRRLPRSETATLLALSTNAVTYDFVRADEEGRPLDGLTTTYLQHSIRSDLLPDLNLRVRYDLFRDDEGERRFDLRLRQVNATFQLTPDSWIARAVGLGRDDGGSGADEAADSTQAAGPDGQLEQTPGGRGGLMPDRAARGGYGVGPGLGGGAPGGGWRASLSYSLERPASGALPTGPSASSGTSQMLRGNVSFQPTRFWSVRWSTGYSFTDGEFSDHILTFSRDLHRWQANFDFVKAQNGNFSFVFRVSLTDNPDIKLDYEQRGEGTARRPGIR